jgi:phospholipid N-methyltransferase
MGGALFEKLKLEAAFMKEFVRAPLHVGSICPSSRALTKTLVQMAGTGREGLIVDLGAGSGIVSQELLRAGVAPERIVAVELSPGFRKTFSRTCPGVAMITGDARDLGKLLGRHAPGAPVCSVISSLPFRVIPRPIVRDILREIRSVLSERGGSLIQYTYAWWMQYPLRKFGFSPAAARLVLKNVPPAKVESYRP